MLEVLQRAYTLLDTVTPLTVDCGQVCDGRCCQQTADSQGMLLFPGEEELAHREGFTLIPADGGTLLVCNGTCKRTERPLSCRLFPLFPVVEEDGRIRAVYDPRGYRLCPLVRECAHVPLRRDFVRAVRQVGRLLMQDPACAAFLRAQSEEIRTLGRLLPQLTERTPIMRRNIHHNDG
ncbi:MAG: hypothetical protein E7541_07370 [Ruminococcaceae bacterium]|nr:hypothetical protein [Oscillospiraceae bacterium]